METVEIPPGFNLGMIIGIGGRIVKDIQHLTGSKVWVDCDRMLVTCKGGDYREAARRVRAQVSSAQTPGIPGTYPHPLSIVYVLPSSPTGSYRFSVYKGPSQPKTVRGRSVPQYVLSPAPASAVASSTAVSDVASTAKSSFYKGINAVVEEVTSQMGASSLSQGLRASAARVSGAGAGGAKESVFLVEPTNEYVKHLKDALAKVRQEDPAFDECKLRFSVGKQTFYESRSPFSASTFTKTYTLEGLQACDIGHDGDFKSMFTNHNDAQRVQDLEHFVTGTLGFRLEEEKVHVSVHLKDHGRPDGAVVGVVISLRVDVAAEDTGLRVRKLKSSAHRSLLVAFLADRPDQPDFRLKLIATYHIRDPDSASASVSAEASRDQQAWAYARACTWSADRRSVVLPSRERFPELLRDTVRMKDKRTYAGRYQGHEIRFTVSETRDEAGSHLEMSGCAPQVQEALQRGDPLPVEPLSALVAFCKRLQGAVTA